MDYMLASLVCDAATCFPSHILSPSCREYPPAFELATKLVTFTDRWDATRQTITVRSELASLRMPVRTRV